MVIQFWLGWFDEGGALVDQRWLEGVDEPEVRRVFEVEPEEWIIDSFPVAPKPHPWLESKGIHVQSGRYEYFVAGLHESILEPP